MKKMSSNQIRQMWLDFFKSKGHQVEQSASLVPQNDPTLLWTNAGVTPLKKYFDGTVIPKNPRITNAQKCIRTNDIENVGKTARHHTFFEMLGNFSIGDYFKTEAIEFAMELLFDEKWFGFSKDKLYITYYSKDLDAKNEWLKNGISEDHLIPLDGNYWEIGEGPCGPDTEMFYDRGEKYDKRGKELIEQDLENDRFIEIWNIVFSQFNSKAGVTRDKYQELPNKNIDTGCGLERLACVMQEVPTNYDTDLFRPIIAKIEEICGIPYTGQMAFKVIADHVRTVTFAVADGATLSNEGRGYVLRRVLRRAIKHAKSLGIQKPFMASLVDVVIDIMENYYPYLNEKVIIVKEIITKEEEKFLATISNGEKKFEQIASLSTKEISGKDAFLLYDTYGFPLELTMEYAAELGLEVNIDEFKIQMEEQKTRARNSRKDFGSMGGQNEAYLNFKEESKFIGYENSTISTTVIGVFENGIVLKETPFYAFSGGQLCDKGYIDDALVLDVIKMPNGQHIHFVESHNFKIGDKVNAIIDLDNRYLTKKNHSSAHLFQASLQKVLGNHVHQQGSQVSSSYMRFDFNNYQNLTDNQIIEIEDLVNKYINESYPVITNVLTIEEAKKTGAMALFGEKYGDYVRVVDMNISKEFCAGTHVSNTKEVEKFMLASVESIGSGTFRATAYTSFNALNLLKESVETLYKDLNAVENKALNIVLNAKAEGINLEYLYDNSLVKNKEGYRFILALKEVILNAKEALYELEKAYNNKKSQNILSNLDIYDSKVTGKVLVTEVEITETSFLKELAIALRNNKNLDLVLLASTEENKVTFVCSANKDIYNANTFVKAATEVTGGGGGGKPDLAQAGGKDPSKTKEALAHVLGMLK